MDSSKLSVKFYLQDESKLKLADVVPVFHSWIQFHSIPNHLLIDVADYAHVPDGPGMLLVSHEANFHMDNFDGRFGLGYWRKALLDGTFTDRLRFVFRAALKACQLIEANDTLGGLKFRTDEVSFKINDRLAAPNAPETFAIVKPDLDKFSRDLFGGNVTLDYQNDPKRLFEVRVKASTQPSIAALLDRLPVQQPA